MKLIVGLGNPGESYKNTKHNIGFDTIDKLCEKLQVKVSKNKKLLGELCKYNDVIILKPTTFMNLSGNSIIQVMNYYNISKEGILVIYDDIDLPIGKTRIRYKGGAGGHNGIKSIIQHVSDEFNRIKIGVGRNLNVETANYVLSKFSKEDRKLIDAAILKSVDVCMDFINNDDILTIMNKHN
ncbi:aminoacyl-tRNA hydrolase [Mycoplasmatota bacterium WC44]